MSEILTFAGTLTLAGQSFYTEFALEASRDQLARLLAALHLPAPETARSANAKNGEPVQRAAVIAKGGDGGHRRKDDRPTLADLNRAKTSKEKWALIDRRFPWLFGDEPDVVKPPESRTDIAKLGGGDAGQADSDWALIEPYLDSLVDDDGRLVRGAQTRIAEILGGSNAGHFREARVKPMVARLKEWIDQEFYLIASTTSPDDGDENDESGDEAARIA